MCMLDYYSDNQQVINFKILNKTQNKAYNNGAKFILPILYYLFLLFTE